MNIELDGMYESLTSQALSKTSGRFCATGREGRRRARTFSYGIRVSARKNSCDLILLNAIFTDALLLVALEDLGYASSSGSTQAVGNVLTTVMTDARSLALARRTGLNPLRSPVNDVPRETAKESLAVRLRFRGHEELSYLDL